MVEAKCSDCQTVKPIATFPRNQARRHGYHNICKPCCNVRNRAYRARNPQTIREQYRRYYQRNREKVIAHTVDWRKANPGKATELSRVSMARQRAVARTAILGAYGGKCVCCGETQPLFLALDHVNNDGWVRRQEARTRSSHSTYRDAIKRGFPPDYQLLCHNCNMGKSLNGGICPHDPPLTKEAVAVGDYA